MHAGCQCPPDRGRPAACGNLDDSLAAAIGSGSRGPGPATPSVSARPAGQCQTWIVISLSWADTVTVTVAVTVAGRGVSLELASCQFLKRSASRRRFWPGLPGPGYQGPDLPVSGPARPGPWHVTGNVKCG